jgi:bifunctional ADP-heptose synthase (sugar kinase/adenylyltransferase)
MEKQLLDEEKDFISAFPKRNSAEYHSAVVQLSTLANTLSERTMKQLLRDETELGLEVQAKGMALVTGVGDRVAKIANARKIITESSPI